MRFRLGAEHPLGHRRDLFRRVADVVDIDLDRRVDVAEEETDPAVAGLERIDEVQLDRRPPFGERDELALPLFARDETPRGRP